MIPPRAHYNTKTYDHGDQKATQVDAWSVLSRLSGFKRVGGAYMARCPGPRHAEGDRNPSLSLKQTSDGTVLLYCHVGCSSQEIVEAAGLQARDLFPRRVERWASDLGDITALYDYRDEQDSLLFQVARFEKRVDGAKQKTFRQRKPDGQGGWLWKLGDVRRVPYLLRNLHTADPDLPVFLAEGEKDVDKLTHLGLVATTNPGGAGKWREEYNPYFQGRKVVILPDNDEAGYNHAEQVFTALKGTAAQVITLKLPGIAAIEKGDVSDWLAQGGANTPALLEELVTLGLKAAPPGASPQSQSLYTSGLGTGDEEQQGHQGRQEHEDPEAHSNTAPTLFEGVLKVWEAEEPKRRPFVIDNLIPDGVVTSLYADGGTGKSYLALLWCILVCLGQSFGGRAVEKRVALYLDGELDADEFVRRAYKVARGLGLSRPPEGLHYYQLQGPLSDAGIQRQVRQVVLGCDAKFIVLDSLTMATYGADPSDPAPTIAVIKYLETLGTVLAIDHMGKPATGANLSNYTQFGSAFKRFAVRSQMQLIRADGGGLSLLHKKANFGPLQTPTHLSMEFGIDKVSFTLVDITDDRMAGIEDHLPAIEQVYRELAQYYDEEHEGALPSFLAQALGTSEKNVKNNLTRLRKEGRAEPIGDGRWRALLSNPKS